MCHWQHSNTGEKDGNQIVMTEGITSMIKSLRGIAETVTLQAGIKNLFSQVSFIGSR